MHSRRCLAACLSLGLAVVSSCNSGSDYTPAPPTFDLNGTWSVEYEVLTATSQCSSLAGQKETTVNQFVVTGNTLTVTHPDSSTTVINLDGSTGSWTDNFVDNSFSFQENGTATFTATTFNATTTWSASDSVSGNSCTGTSKLTGVKTSTSTLEDMHGNSEVSMYVVYDDNSVEFRSYLNQRPTRGSRKSSRLMRLLQHELSSGH